MSTETIERTATVHGPHGSMPATTDNVLRSMQSAIDAKRGADDETMTTTIEETRAIITLPAETAAATLSAATAAITGRPDRETVTGVDPDVPAPVPDDTEFGEEGAFLDAGHRGGAWRFSPIVAALIDDDPEALGHLQTATFRCLWQRVGAKQAGEPVLGKASRPGKLQRFLAGEVDFFLIIAADVARDAGLTNWQLEAQVYGLLCSCDVDPETGKPATRPPEFSGYVVELARYGVWSMGLRRARVAFEQLRFDGIGR